jgi:biotin transporter BioY
MTQETILVLLAGLIGVLFAVLVGFVWMMVRAGLDDDHDTQDTHDNRQGSASPEPRDGEEAYEGSPRQSKVAA